MVPARLTGLLLATLPAVVLADDPARRVAVTFDDLPTVSIADATDEGRRRVTENLLESLVNLDIPVTGFVNESKLADDSGEIVDAQVDLLRLWLDAGFDLGNHSYAHPDLHRVSLEVFQADVLRGERVTRRLLAESGKSLRYFRHPFLHTGLSLEVKADFEHFLEEHGYRVAPVSIDNSEWIFARAYVNALQSADEALAARIGGDYIEYMLAMVAYYEDQSAKLFARNIAHVLLVHANQLNADWFGVLANRLADIGYEFVSLDEALEDPAYASPDEYTGSGGITWLHRWAITRQVDRAMFQGEPLTPDYVRRIAGL